MEYILPPTAEPFGPACIECELFAESKCLGVSTVRVVLGTAEAMEEATSTGIEIDLSLLQHRAVKRSFRILERALRYCPGPGNDGRGDFRPSRDTMSGYISSAIIKTAFSQIEFNSTKSRPPVLTSSGHSFTSSETAQKEGGAFNQKA